MVAAPASAKTVKYTFNDVQLPDGQTGEIEATVKDQKNKADSVYCGYFSDDYAESLGYYYDTVEVAPADADAVLEWCLDEFDERVS